MESKHANIDLKTIIIFEFLDKINDDSSSTIIALLIFALGFKFYFTDAFVLFWLICFRLIFFVCFSLNISILLVVLIVYKI